MYMKNKKLRIAIPTKGQNGLDDVLSDVFGRANTYTIVDVEKGVIKNVETLGNPAVSYKHGAGPIVVKMLIDAGVDMVLAPELGPGASALLEQHDIPTIVVTPGTGVEKSVREALAKSGNSRIR
jgi:predicted Fe-Mo cluster-binding NifX family protein